MHILIVEDEEDIRLLLRRGFSMHDATFEISEAANGMEAIHQIAANAPDAILLDMLMPDIDGWEFLQVLDALEARIPVAILTAVHRENAALSGVMATYPNVVDIINKPLALDHMAHIIAILREASQKHSPPR